MAGIRPFEPDDLPRVAAIFQRAFRSGGPPSAALMDALRELLLEHPYQDPEIRSLVHIRAGGVLDGFVGALPQPMQFRDRRLRGAIMFGLAVEDPRASPAAGGLLLRRLGNGPQDLTMTDTANRRTYQLQAALKWRTLNLQSLQWTKVLRPASSAVALGRERIHALRRLPLGLAARLADPAFRASRNLYHRADPGRQDWTDADVTHDSFAEIFLALTERFQLRPAWTRADLVWLLRHAERKQRFGPMSVRGVYDRRGEPIGAYVYYGRPHERAILVQAVCRPAAGKAVLASLFDDALARGCPLVEGAAQPYLMDALFRHDGIGFRHRAGTHLRTRDPELLAALDAQDILLGGLAGERWTLLA